MRCGDSKSAMAQGPAASSARRRLRSAPLAGRKPAKTTPSAAMPLAESAAVSALGAGDRERRGSPRRARGRRGARRDRSPRACRRRSPARRTCPRAAGRRCPRPPSRSLCSCSAITRAPMPKCARSDLRDARVLGRDHVAARRASRGARAVMSPRFPMGVATTYNPAGNAAARPSAAGEPESPLLPSPFARFNAILLAALPRGSAGILGRPAARDNLAVRLRAVDGRHAAAGRVRRARRRPPRPGQLGPLPPRPRGSPSPRAPRRTWRSSCRCPRRPSAAWPTRCARASSRPREVAGSNALPVRVYSDRRRRPRRRSSSCRKAQRDGAVLVVAGLTRDGATGLARSDCPRQPTLVLNQPQDPSCRRGCTRSRSRPSRRRGRRRSWPSTTAGARPSSSPRPRRSRGACSEAFEREWGRAAGEVRRVVLRRRSGRRARHQGEDRRPCGRHGLPRPRPGRHARGAPLHLGHAARSTPPRWASTRAPRPRSTWTWRVCVMWTCPGSSSPTIPP